MWHVIEFERDSKKTTDTMEQYDPVGQYDHTCVLDSSFGCYMEIPSKTRIKRFL